MLLEYGFNVVVLLVGLQAGGKLFSTLSSRSNVFVTTTYHPVLVSNDQRDKTTTAGPAFWDLASVVVKGVGGERGVRRRKSDYVER